MAEYNILVRQYRYDLLISSGLELAGSFAGAGFRKFRKLFFIAEMSGRFSPLFISVDLYRLIF